MEAKQRQLLVGMGVPTKEENESNLAMLWGSINEDSALVTYLK